MITLAAFILTQAGVGYALRIEQAKGNRVGENLAKALGEQFQANASGDLAALLEEIDNIANDKSKFPTDKKDAVLNLTSQIRKILSSMTDQEQEYVLSSLLVSGQINTLRRFIKINPKNQTIPQLQTLMEKIKITRQDLNSDANAKDFLRLNLGEDLFKKLETEFREFIGEYGYKPFKDLYAIAKAENIPVDILFLRLFTAKDLIKDGESLIKIGNDIIRSLIAIEDSIAEKFLRSKLSKNLFKQIETEFGEIIKIYGYRSFRDLYISSGGEDSNYLFDEEDETFCLADLKEMFTEDELKEYWPDLVRLGIATGTDSYWFFSSGLPTVRNLISDKESLNQIGDYLIQLDGISGGQGYAIWQGLYGLKDLITDIESLNKISDELIQLCNINNNMVDVITDQLHYINAIFTADELKEYWPDLFQLIADSGENAYELLGCMETVKYLITNKESLHQISKDIIRLLIAAKEKRDSLHEFLHIFKYLIFDRESLNQISNDFVQLLNMENTSGYGLNFNLSNFKHLITDRESLCQVGNDIVRLTKSQEKQHIVSTSNYYSIDNISHLIATSQELKDFVDAFIKIGYAIFTKHIFNKFIQSQDRPAFIEKIVEVSLIIQQGKFDINNEMHLFANYALLLQQVSNSSARREVTWEDYLKIIEKAKVQVNVIEDDVTPQQDLEIRGLVYEAALLRQMILNIQKRAQELGRPVVVVENLSYGAVALSPITEERNGQRYIIGTNILVISTKVGSTECHDNEIYLRPDLFSKAEKRFIMIEKPIVVVVDGSTSVSDPERTSAHIPDGFKGYRNYFVTVDSALGITVDSSNFHLNEGFLQTLSQDRFFKNLIKVLKETSIEPKTKQPYKLLFWYPGNKELYLRAGKIVDTPAFKLQDVSEITGPSLIFVESAMEPEAVPNDIKRDFLRGEHHPAYFDDTDHFKEFYLDYEEGYGVVLSKKFINFARRYFMEFAAQYGIEIAPSVQTQAIPPRGIDIIALDLDGTIALTDQPPTQEMLNTLISLLNKGKKILITTEDLEQNLDERLINLMPEHLRQNLVIFSDGGTNGFTFTETGEKTYFDDYNQKSKISPELRSKILALLSEHLAGQYEIDIRPNRISPEYRIDLFNVKDRDNFIKQVSSLLEQNNISAKVYKVGRTSIKIVLQHKEDALAYWINKQQADISCTLIIGDSAKTNQSDRELLISFPEAVSISVGRYANTIFERNPNIVQLVQEGIKGAYRFLSILDKQGFIPQAFIKSTNGQKMSESHLSETDTDAYGHAEGTGETQANASGNLIVLLEKIDQIANDASKFPLAKKDAVLNLTAKIREMLSSMTVEEQVFVLSSPAVLGQINITRRLVGINPKAQTIPQLETLIEKINSVKQSFNTDLTERDFLQSKLGEDLFNRLQTEFREFIGKYGYKPFKDLYIAAGEHSTVLFQRLFLAKETIVDEASLNKRGSDLIQFFNRGSEANRFILSEAEYGETVKEIIEQTITKEPPINDDNIPDNVAGVHGTSVKAIRYLMEHGVLPTDKNRIPGEFYFYPAGYNQSAEGAVSAAINYSQWNTQKHYIGYKIAEIFSFEDDTEFMEQLSIFATMGFEDDYQYFLVKCLEHGISEDQLDEWRTETDIKLPDLSGVVILLSKDLIRDFPTHRNSDGEGFIDIQGGVPLKYIAGILPIGDRALQELGIETTANLVGDVERAAAINAALQKAEEASDVQLVAAVRTELAKLKVPELAALVVISDDDLRESVKNSLLSHWGFNEDEVVAVADESQLTYEQTNIEFIIIIKDKSASVTSVNDIVNLGPIDIDNEIELNNLVRERLESV